jgi:para-aminobenzoate synthetase component 1
VRSLSQVYGLENQFWMGGRLATQLEEISNNPSVLADGNFWAIVITFEGEATFARFATVEDAQFPLSQWDEIATPWRSSCDRDGYIAYVDAIREEIAAGGVYQVNACYELTNQLAQPSDSLAGLFSQLISKNPAPYAQYLHLPEIEIASASPERLLSRRGQEITTSPIKGTIRSDEQTFGEKDKAENLMIVDLMRNDFGRICESGSVAVTELFRTEKHPGLRHLVSDVTGTLTGQLKWSQIFEALAPAGSISGAPKSAALRIINTHEEVRRGPYCGAIGWVQGDRAEIAVGIRTFWRTKKDVLRFGTGAGITWASDAGAEWEETRLKARHLLNIAGGEIQ